MYSMERFLLLATILLFLLSAPAIEAGRLMREENLENPSVIQEGAIPSLESKNENLMAGVKKVPSLEASLVLAALPKGNIPSSGPSKKVHSEIVDQKLFARHSPERMDRFLKSVPSPGAGH